MEGLKNSLLCAAVVALVTAILVAARAFIDGEAPDADVMFASVAAFLALVESLEANSKLNELAKKVGGDVARKEGSTLPRGGGEGR